MISKQYVNLALLFGYHFALLDTYCREREANNHVYFRFVGGATDIIKRSRRIQFIGLVLKEYGFVTQNKGDLIIARLSHIDLKEVLKILDIAGWLIAFSRQLDGLLKEDSQIEFYFKRFLKKTYTL